MTWVIGAIDASPCLVSAMIRDAFGATIGRLLGKELGETVVSAEERPVWS